LLNLLRLVTYLALTFTLIPVQMLALALGCRLADRLPSRYHAMVCRIFGLEIEIRGEISRAVPTMFVANHISYLDIATLGATVPAQFVAKADIADWPLFGFLAKLQRTIFVDRRVRSSAKQRDSLVERLQGGTSIIMFPEGTSGDGSRVLPFKSALFSAAAVEVAAGPITVQPVSVTYTKLNGMPLGRHFMPFVAWYGDMELLPHMWQLIGLGHINVIVHFHAPVSLAAFSSRKQLAQHCYTVIADAVSAGGRGSDMSRS